jgi:hypothetical protein
MLVAKVIETVGSAGNLQSTDLAAFGQPLKVSVYGCPTDAGMLLCQLGVDLVGSRVTPELIDGFKNQCALNRVASSHEAAPPNNSHY